jgi:hypothetical protein
VAWFETVVAPRDKEPEAGQKVDRCDTVAGGQATECQLASLKRGGWDVFVRAVNDAGASDWFMAAPVGINSCTDVDAAAGTCEEFDKGPGGGLVFYDAGARQSWGRYLEAAPPGWSGTPQDPKAPWLHYLEQDKDKDFGPPGLPIGYIGEGRAATEAIVRAYGSGTGAALAKSYRGGGRSDWFLPTRYEAYKMYDKRSEIGAFEPAATQTSSWKLKIEEDGNNFPCIALARENYIQCGDYDRPLAVRPIRAF